MTNKNLKSLYNNLSLNDKVKTLSMDIDLYKVEVDNLMTFKGSVGVLVEAFTLGFNKNIARGQIRPTVIKMCAEPEVSPDVRKYYYAKYGIKQAPTQLGK